LDAGAWIGNVYEDAFGSFVVFTFDSSTDW